MIVPTFASLPTWLVIIAPKLVTAGFIFAFGACVGSFLNVVAHRLPAGRSVVSPPSRCPRCGWRLTWRENLPIIGWLLLRGRCRRCRQSISIQYPAIELLVAVFFAGTYLLLYAVPDGTAFAEIGGSWWRQGRFGGTWPAFAVLMAMVSGLAVATIVDARTFLIPAPITNAMLLIAFLGWFLQGVLPATPALELLESDGRGPIPGVNWTISGVVLGSAIGLLLSIFLLQTGRIRRSFADYEEYVTEDAPLAEYPHGRREMGKELVFLLPILVGGGLGWLLVSQLQPEADSPPRLIEYLASAGLGCLVGGGIVWLVRILGTLAFGREAMGMGDVHLLAAVGAALGWADPVRVFFIAPFLALAWIGSGRVLSLFRKGTASELPYGPHLAMATILVVYARPWIEMAEQALLTPPG
ncbi:MAG: prepilin peptidase [Phycisphaera sp.]|nr:prepilin peptidase [Phycisphaera sp.]